MTTDTRQPMEVKYYGMIESGDPSLLASDYPEQRREFGSKAEAKQWFREFLEETVEPLREIANAPVWLALYTRDPIEELDPPCVAMIGLGPRGGIATL